MYHNDLIIYNSINKKKEIFHPIHKKYVGIYVCGPTVYNHIHLGNCRTFVFFDVVYRYLKHLGYQVRYVRNITDVGHLENDRQSYQDDKIIKRSRIEGLEPMEIVQKYTISFHNFLRKLNLLPPNIEPTATGHIIEQIDIIQQLICKKIAYISNGSIYFSLKNYTKLYTYGILSKNKIQNLFNKKTHFSNEKYSYQDFCLWKRSIHNHIMNWNSPWGIGFPGWHIECSTMSTKYLGKIFDIHGGGLDLKFPHHECEIAQSVAFYNDENCFARYWMHTNMLTFNGQKMSKSVGNTITLKDLVEKKNISPNVIKFFILQTHYRNVLNFSEKNLLNAKNGLNRIIESIQKLQSFDEKNMLENNNNFNVFIWIKKCYYAINDDFNIPLLIYYLFQATRVIDSLSIENMNKYYFNFFKSYIIYFVFHILGIQNETKNNSDKKLQILIEKIQHIRQYFRMQKNWIISDKIREELGSIGILLKDKKLF
ncbi:cysteine--tRNA ligase [Blattabacterium cuenoti]|uniref:cysteine--tRNA ligase n=1 Tax=Blattabacterium cuenoti TaxID=1653831 RepID=UPI00163D368D|nr:cysteine--tRNA ligase [Blattabacterium cuenoti]